MASGRLLEKTWATDPLRAAAEFLRQRLMELEVDAQVDAGRHERSPRRVTWRNGSRERASETRPGRLEPRILKLRQGSHFPRLLEPGQLSEQAVVQQAWVPGVSMRKVDDPVAGPAPVRTTHTRRAEAA